MSGPGDPRNSDNNDTRWAPTSTTPQPGQGGGGGGADAAGTNPCVFTEETILASPNMAVISTISVGAILKVVQAGSRVVAQAPAGTAGAITSARLPDIIQCLNAGQKYLASVTQISGGAVTVEIYPA
ncbi:MULTISPECIES: hypothetical protein [unclassified Rhizobium]|uniref:hypothetical protein n=1 Tax=unclassified Rhizobium TaxID=2613769 RepID=UPI00288979B7|nr:MULTISPECIES: hypothetical protein [unclassified Rhizobium]